MHYLYTRFCLRVSSSFLSEKGSYSIRDKSVRHFCKMTPFSIVDMYLSPSPVFPHPLSPKSMLYFKLSSLSFTSDNIDSGVGWGDLQHLKRMK